MQKNDESFAEKVIPANDSVRLLDQMVEEMDLTPLNTSNIIRIEEEYKRRMRQLCYKDDILRAAGLDSSFDRQ